MDRYDKEPGGREVLEYVRRELYPDALEIECRHVFSDLYAIEVWDSDESPPERFLFANPLSRQSRPGAADDTPSDTR